MRLRSLMGLRRALPLCLALVHIGALLAGLLACTTPEPWDLAAPISPFQLSQGVAGKLAVIHGSSCGTRAYKKETAELPKSQTLPPYTDRATVFLNGWMFQYEEKDHHLSKIEIRIEDIVQVGDTLKWIARGAISDKNFDDPYRLCYFYTVLAWQSSAIDAAVDIGHFNSFPYWGPDNHSALNVASATPKQTISESKQGIAVLPRGFVLGFGAETGLWPVARFDEPADHQILQIAYSLNRNVPFDAGADVYENDGPQSVLGTKGLVRRNAASWDTHAIIKDKKTRRGNPYLWEDVSILVGNGIATVKPPFSILPVKPSGGTFVSTGWLSASTSPVLTEQIEIGNVPFEYAVPVLTGWDLAYRDSDDEHVKHVGIFLHEIEYDKPPGTSHGTLRYKVSSVLADKSATPPHRTRHRVDVLGFSSTPPADLVPRSQRGDFCQRDAQGRLLVEIANLGAGHAPASVTRFDFGAGRTVDVPTPGVPGGYAGPLDPVAIPSDCVIGEECRFSVEVDAEGQVNETIENNNLRQGKCAFPD